MTTFSDTEEVCVRCGKFTENLVNLIGQDDHTYIYICDDCFNPKTDVYPDEGSCYGSEYWD